MVYQLAHTSIVVRDINETINFYTNIFGLKVFRETETEKLKLALLQAGNGTIELLEYKNIEYAKRERGTVDHIAFFVESVEKAMFEISKIADVKYLCKPQMLEDKGLVFIEGLNGERIELIEK